MFFYSVAVVSGNKVLKVRFCHASAMLSAVIGNNLDCMSFRPSVCLSHCGIITAIMRFLLHDISRNGFSTQKAAKKFDMGPT